MHGSKNNFQAAQRRWRLLVLAPVLVGGLVLAACGSSSSSGPATTTTAKSASSATTPAPTGNATSALNKLASGISKSANSTFSATYVIAHSQAGQSETITFAQSPPKSSIQTSSVHFITDGKSITECTGTDCTSLPSSMAGSLTSITDLFSPSFMGNVIKGIQNNALSGVPGFKATVSSASYAGQASTCVTVTDTASPTPATYCAANSTGLLTYSSVAGSTVTLSAYSASPDSSLFAPPAGATVVTLPAGA